jgi:hypothetical protein
VSHVPRQRGHATMRLTVPPNPRTFVLRARIGIRAGHFSNVGSADGSGGAYREIDTERDSLRRVPACNFRSPAGKSCSARRRTPHAGTRMLPSPTQRQFFQPFLWNCMRRAPRRNGVSALLHHKVKVYGLWPRPLPDRRAFSENYHENRSRRLGRRRRHSRLYTERNGTRIDLGATYTPAKPLQCLFVTSAAILPSAELSTCAASRVASANGSTCRGSEIDHDFRNPGRFFNCFKIALQSRK